MGKHHNKMPKALVEAQKAEQQQRFPTIHESPEETSPVNRKEVERQARIELMSNRNSFFIARPRDYFPRQNGDGVHAGLDYILASNNGAALYDPTA